MRTFLTVIVHTIEPASDTLGMEEVVKLFSKAFEQNFVNHLSDPAQTNSLAHAVDYTPF